MKIQMISSTLILIITLALLFAGCLGDDEGDRKMDLTIEIAYEGDWTATIDVDGDLQEVSGAGTQTVNVTAEKVTVNVTRTDDGAGPISINILAGELPLAGSASLHEYETITYPDDEE